MTYRIVICLFQVYPVIVLKMLFGSLLPFNCNNVLDSDLERAIC